MSNPPLGKDRSQIRCLYCAYYIEKPYPRDQRCPNCRKPLDIMGYARKANILRRFEEREGIRGVITCNSSGLVIDSNVDIEISEEIPAFVTSLIGKGKQLVEALKEGGLKFIRLETSKGETMIALEEQLILIILK